MKNKYIYLIIVFLLSTSCSSKHFTNKQYNHRQYVKTSADKITIAKKTPEKEQSITLINHYTDTLAHIKPTTTILDSLPDYTNTFFSMITKGKYNENNVEVVNRISNFKSEYSKLIERLNQQKPLKKSQTKGAGLILALIGFILSIIAFVFTVLSIVFGILALINGDMGPWGWITITAFAVSSVSLILVMLSLAWPEDGLGFRTAGKIIVIPAFIISTLLFITWLVLVL